MSVLRTVEQNWNKRVLIANVMGWAASTPASPAYLWVVLPIQKRCNPDLDPGLIGVRRLVLNDLDRHHLFSLLDLAPEYLWSRAQLRSGFLTSKGYAHGGGSREAQGSSRVCVVLHLAESALA